jgi:plasmid stability protein
MISSGESMAQLVVRNLEARVKARLQRRARRNGRSMEEEVRDILRSAAKDDTKTPMGGLGTELAALFPKSGPDFQIEELRGFEVEPPTFEE